MISSARLLLVFVGICWFLVPSAFAQGDVSYPKRITQTPADLLGAEGAAEISQVFPADGDIEWKLHVPDTYDPSVPAGLFVYISPTNSGRIPNRWRRVMRAQNLIYISADNSGNEADTRHRMLFANLAVTLARKEFSLDPERTYISGFSGGGRVASFMAALFSTTFTGGLYICGVEYRTLTEPGAGFSDMRHVLLTGHQDFNRQPTKATFEQMREDGIETVHLMDIRNFDHELPRANHLTEAIAFLDGEVSQTASADPN